MRDVVASLLESQTITSVLEKGPCLLPPPNWASRGGGNVEQIIGRFRGPEPHLFSLIKAPMQPSLEWYIRGSCGIVWVDRLVAGSLSPQHLQPLPGSIEHTFCTQGHPRSAWLGLSVKALQWEWGGIIISDWYQTILSPSGCQQEVTILIKHQTRQGAPLWIPKG